MTDVGNRSITTVVLMDAVLTYAYMFTANAFIGEVEGPHAPGTYWLTQLWVYFLIAPVAAVACWRGARQVQDAWTGRPRWWRLTVEGVAIGAACIAAVGLMIASWSDFVLMLRDVIILCGGLGLVLTSANYPLAYVLRPRLEHA